MTKMEIYEMALDLMDKYNVNLPVRFTRAKTGLGAIMFSRLTGEAVEMKLSETILTRVDESIVRDTILHEIAHVLAGRKAGHGRLWKLQAMRVGANPTRTASLPASVKSQISRYCIVCEKCGQKEYYNRALKYDISSYYHKDCGGRWSKA